VSPGGADGPKRPKEGLIRNSWLRRPIKYLDYFFHQLLGDDRANEHVRKYFSPRTMDGLAATANTARKIDDFRAAFEAYDAKPPTHTPQMSRVLRSGIPSLSCPVPKNFGPLANLMGEFFQ